MSARHADGQLAGMSAEVRQARQREIATGRQIVRHVTSEGGRQQLALTIDAAPRHEVREIRDWLLDLVGMLVELYGDVQAAHEELER